MIEEETSPVEANSSKKETIRAFQATSALIYPLDEES